MRQTVTERLAGLAACLLIAACQQHEADFLPQYPVVHLLIENGIVVDGLGNEPVAADVVVVGDEIIYVGDVLFLAQDRVRRRIDAEGRVVAPGFIDLHSHGDPLETPAFENFLAMGVTTITLGQDGSSPEYDDLSGWLAEVAQRGIGLNLAMFVGHGTLRKLSGIGMAQTPEPAAMARMLDILDTTLDYTFGLSTGLEYNPGLQALPGELNELAAVVGQNDRMIMSHLRNEDDDQLYSALAELFTQGEYARVHVSHLKSVYGQGAARAEEILTVLDNARLGRRSITADVYPYTASYTGIGIVFPDWAKTAEQFEIAKAERREELADFLRKRVTRRNGPESTLFGTDPYTGKTLAELAHELETPFEDVLIDAIGPQGASAAYFVMNDELQARLLQDSHIGICSDGSPTGFHPRGHGTFARIIERYVEREGLLSLPEAIRKMSSFPAGILGIADRGAVQAGMRADLIVFDPESVRETATYPAPLNLAEGFDIVVINGSVAREYGALDEALHGRVLRPDPP